MRLFSFFSMRLTRILLPFLCVIIGTFDAFAQINYGFDSGADEYRLQRLLKPEVHEDQVMFKKTIWRRMNLKERQNLPFYSLGKELPKLLVEATDLGYITSYRSDSCVGFMPDIIFISNVSIELATNPFVGDGFGAGADDFLDDDESDTTNLEEENDELEEEESLQRFEIIPPDLFYIVYIREEVIFDRNRSRMYSYIKSFSLALPSDVGTDYNPGGFEKIVAHYKYEDIVELFRGEYSDRAIYFNDRNLGGRSMNMTDAFELRLFNAPIIKMSNSRNLDIRQLYADDISNPEKIIKIQQKYEYDLMEYESELWEN